MFHNDQSFKQEVLESIFQRARAVQKSLVIIAVTREEKKKKKKSGRRERGETKGLLKDCKKCMEAFKIKNKL